MGGPYLLKAIGKGDADDLRTLLDRNADPNTKLRDKDLPSWIPPMPALLSATHMDNPSCVRLLLERGANIEATDHRGNTALELAADFGCTECLKLLLPMSPVWMLRQIQRLSAATRAPAHSDQTSGGDDTTVEEPVGVRRRLAPCNAHHPAFKAFINDLKY